MTMSEHEKSETERVALMALDNYLGKARELAKAKREAQRVRRWTDANVPNEGPGWNLHHHANERLTRASGALWEHLQFGSRNLGLLADILTERDAEAEGGDAE